MPIHLPASLDEAPPPAAPAADALTPRQIVAELDRHVVGQSAAKRAVAIALRNRIRRQRLSPDEAAEITKKMLGMTLVTHQTGPEGRVVRKVLIEEALNIDKELYLAITLDRASATLSASGIDSSSVRWMASL